MNVIVCIKQVPGASLPLDAAGGLDRSRGGSQLNPCDAYALEAGLRLAEAFGGRVTALTMGPENAEKVLRIACGMGVHQAVLLSDRAFAGADVLATAHTLAQGIRKIGDAAWIVCGQQTTDGDTAQLPASLAAQLQRPVIGWIKQLEIGTDGVTAYQELSQGTQKCRISGPCVLAVGPGIGAPRIPSLRQQLRARTVEITRLCLSDLADADPAHYGQQGSATTVRGLREVHPQPKTAPLSVAPAAAAQLILGLVKEAKANE